MYFIIVKFIELGKRQKEERRSLRQGVLSIYTQKNATITIVALKF